MNDLKQHPLVTVMMPCFNNSAYIHQTIESVLKQSYSNIELLICDDDSTDTSRQIINSIGDGRIRLIKNVQNCGIASVRNRLLREAAGQWVTSLDGDDLYVDSDKLLTEWQLIEKVDQTARPAIAFSDVVWIDSQGKHLATASEMATVQQGIIYQSLFDRECMIPRDYLVSKKLAQSVGGFDESLPIFEDFDFKLRLAAAANFFFTGRAGIGYRRHSAGLSNRPEQYHKKILSCLKSRYGLADGTLATNPSHPPRHIASLQIRPKPLLYVGSGVRHVG